MPKLTRKLHPECADPSLSCLSVILYTRANDTQGARLNTQGEVSEGRYEALVLSPSRAHLKDWALLRLAPRTVYIPAMIRTARHGTHGVGALVRIRRLARSGSQRKVRVLVWGAVHLRGVGVLGVDALRRVLRGRRVRVGTVIAVGGHGDNLARGVVQLGRGAVPLTLRRWALLHDRHWWRGMMLLWSRDLVEVLAALAAAEDAASHDGDDDYQDHDPAGDSGDGADGDAVLFRLRHLRLSGSRGAICPGGG